MLAMVETFEVDWPEIHVRLYGTNKAYQMKQFDAAYGMTSLFVEEARRRNLPVITLRELPSPKTPTVLLKSPKRPVSPVAADMKLSPKGRGRAHVPRAQPNFPVGSSVLGQFSEDNLWYDAVVQDVSISLTAV